MGSEMCIRDRNESAIQVSAHSAVPKRYVSRLGPQSRFGDNLLGIRVRYILYNAAPQQKGQAVSPLLHLLVSPRSLYLDRYVILPQPGGQVKAVLHPGLGEKHGSPAEKEHEKRRRGETLKKKKGDQKNGKQRTTKTIL